MIEFQHRLGKVTRDGIDIGRGQVGGHGFNMHLLPLEDFPEPFQDSGTFALPDIDDGTTFQVKYDGQVAMAFANADFIDGDLFKFMEPGEAKRFIRFRFRISLMTVKAL